MRKLSFLLVLVAGCGNSSVTQQTGAAACITASACGIIAGGISVCTQVISFVNDPEQAARAHISASEVNCIAAAGSDCVAAKKCLAGGMTPAVCSGASESCVGNTWESCNALAGSGGNNGMQTFDCSAFGQMCVAQNGNVDCGYGTCSGGSGTCVGPDGVSSGNLVQTCENGILHRADCTKLSATCNPSGTAHCRGNGVACSSPSLFNDTLRCDGNVVVHCLDGQEGREDCSVRNLGCFPRPNGAAGFGCFAGNDCDPNNYPASCVGTKLTFCNNGKIATADCGAAGFTTCNPNGGGSCSK